MTIKDYNGLYLQWVLCGCSDGVVCPTCSQTCYRGVLDTGWSHMQDCIVWNSIALPIAIVGNPYSWRLLQIASFGKSQPCIMILIDDRPLSMITNDYY